jgi:hypothetical protein
MVASVYSLDFDEIYVESAGLDTETITKIKNSQ